ncbi:MAG TPA: cation diffusion facilitator family transporter [bacterium]|nr:cation diffusion facilitator family transporter [bacterium]HNS34199.1 cation diffusion facilitator family transporter [bacterium]HNZ73456.1 cation diffusion facilitator family transporter [bacterium]HOH67409.1 cation diffusion facilitator family transporter [bacterium]
MHKHNHNNREKNIKTAVFLNVSFTIIEIIGGIWTNSLAILSDALHDFGDSIALITSWIAERKAKKPADIKRTYGYQRLSLFSSVFAGVVLVAGSLFILSQTIPRLLNPEHTNAPGMIGLAILGIVVNGLAVLRLKQGQSQNEKVLSWHLLEDVLGWIGILIGGIIMTFWDNHIIDPIMTLGFTTFMLWGVGKNLKGTFNIFMQGVPEHINVDKIKETILKIKEIKGIHDIHIWSLEGETDIFSGHIVVDEDALQKPDNVKKKIKHIIAKHHIEHSTIELESEQFCSGIDCDNNYHKQ